MLPERVGLIVEVGPDGLVEVETVTGYVSFYVEEGTVIDGILSVKLCLIDGENATIVLPGDPLWGGSKVVVRLSRIKQDEI